jgi:hypothetical protein
MRPKLGYISHRRTGRPQGFEEARDRDAADFSNQLILKSNMHYWPPILRRRYSPTFLRRSSISLLYLLTHTEIQSGMHKAKGEPGV